MATADETLSPSPEVPAAAVATDIVFIEGCTETGVQEVCKRH